MKYRIEIERCDDSPRPWEWRIWTRDGGAEFGDEPDVAGSKRSASEAFDEAVITLGKIDGEEN